MSESYQPRTPKWIVTLRGAIKNGRARQTSFPVWAKTEAAAREYASSVIERGGYEAIVSVKSPPKYFQ